MAFFLGRRRCLLLLLLVCFTAGVRVNRAAPPLAAPSPAPDCSTEITNLIDCLSFVVNGSNVTKPEGHCCSNLRMVVKEAPVCLCDLFTQGASFNVNITKALTLPSVCHVSTPSASNCNVSIAGAPGAAPGAAPGQSLSNGAPSSASTTGGASPAPAESTAAAPPALSFKFLSGFAVVLWFYYQSH